MSAFNIEGKKGQFLVTTFGQHFVCKDENAARALCLKHKDSIIWEWMRKDWTILAQENNGKIINEYL
jgi:hypothetical protein